MILHMAIGIHTGRQYIKNCKEEGKKLEAYECQKIDADCNDCKHFLRQDNKSNGIWHGFCNKKQVNTVAYVNFCSSNECFEHRKD